MAHVRIASLTRSREPIDCYCARAFVRLYLIRICVHSFASLIYSSLERLVEDAVSNSPNKYELTGALLELVRAICLVETFARERETTVRICLLARSI